MQDISINHHAIGAKHPAYFIADIAANHDGVLDRAKKLIKLAKEAGADAAKFQNFQARKIVSRQGFGAIGKQVSHQASWKKSVFQVYREASIPLTWSRELKEFCTTIGIDYFSAPYDFEAVDHLEQYVPAYKIGSGDITWTQLIEYIAKKKKPVLLATGASDITEVDQAVKTILRHNNQLILMQCNTNYTGSTQNFNHLHLRVLQTYQHKYPDLILGLSDHTPGHIAVLGAVSLGAKVIEKHFTDDTSRSGPDHSFSMNPADWHEMVHQTRNLEAALGENVKKVEENERDTVILQRRCLYTTQDIAKGSRITTDMTEALRPAPAGTVLPYEQHEIIGKTIRQNIAKGEAIHWSMINQ